MFGYQQSAHGSTSQYNDSDRLSTPAAYGKAAMDGYRKDIMNGFEQEAPRLNPSAQLNPERPESSVLVDLKDPIQVHLLTETALTDSKQYTILSQEEVDDLKKQCQYLQQRIDSVRQNLAIQSKYRDAAISMAKLYSSGRPESGSKRRSFRSNRSSAGEQQVREAEIERETCERKCEELATELFGLEKRMMEPQRKLLEHTAGILQLTHKTSDRKDGAPSQQGQLVNGMPGSPESMYTMNREYDQDSFETYFEDSGFQHLDRKPLEPSPLEIPIKSPIREQQTQLREEVERAREEKDSLLASVTEMERKFESLNMAVRETIIRFNPAVNGDYDDPPYSAPEQDTIPGEMLRYHMEYLQSGLVAIQAEQEAAGPSQVQGQDPATEIVLNSLWETIQSALAGMRQRREERRRARQDKGLGDDEDMSEDEGFDTEEPFTLTGFDTRIRWLQRQATTLKDQKSVLKRQIKQQRELNNKSDAEKDEELHRKQQEVEESRILVNRAEQDTMDAQKMLSEALEDLEQARAAATEGAELRARAADADAMEAELKQALRDLKAAKAGEEQKLATLDADIAGLRAELEEASRAQREAEVVAQDLQGQLDVKMAALKAKEDEADQMGMTMAELKTEVTLARAELDGAYGTRAERAADVAAQQTSAEAAKLRDQVATLKSELAETVQELEEITKETIGAEREKGELEGRLDEALHERELAEGETAALRERMEQEAAKARELVGKLQEELDGEKLKSGGGSGRAGGAGASMLSEQFRATMREERKKFQEDIREERAKNRRLEEELAKLRRAQGPGRSPLSPRV
ncbi:up-regulated during septation domain-containing protein [Sarocladium implicatum]|nr:up-regulated during septation domain-containing protein [Sarocladium implicatum]